MDFENTVADVACQCGDLILTSQNDGGILGALDLDDKF